MIPKYLSSEELKQIEQSIKLEWVTKTPVCPVCSGEDFDFLGKIYRSVHSLDSEDASDDGCILFQTYATCCSCCGYMMEYKRKDKK